MDFEKDITACLTTLKSGGLILYPTDTVWGLGCDATNEEAVNKIFLLKQRPASKSMIVLVAEEKDVLKYTASTDLAVFDYLEKINKPTTVIFENAIGLAENLLASDGSIAIRIARDEFCRHLIKRFRKPVVSTSANISMQPTPVHFNQVSAGIKEGVDYIVQYRQDDLSPAVPSAIIKWNLDGTVSVIRE
ncbi:MAG TPA: L-threonylcarbamoyladenylate synthase [Chitinophagaceae bacterium]|jgi:Sua5/YciO/YrdC/YwlC family protein